MKDRVSAHSGLPESVELRMMAEKHEAIKAKKESQIAQIMNVLHQMPKRERMQMVIEVAKRVRGEK